MSKVEKKIKKIEDDIKSIKIQGATNVGLATIKGVKIYVKEAKQFDFDEVLEVGKRLSNARENEPLARNVVKYINYVKEEEKEKAKDKGINFKDLILKACDNYECIIAEGKEEIVKYGTQALEKEQVVLTHCHSSTSTTTLKNVAKLKEIKREEFKVVATETRPRYQGRKTAKELFEAGIDVTQIVDSACASFIVDDKYLPVGAVIVGCDELLKDGSFINKVGTYSIALASKKGVDEFYVATTLLKLDPQREPHIADIEQRDAREVWDQAPKGLKIINPAFERVRGEYVTGYITEAGILTSEELTKEARNTYPWLFNMK